MQKKSRYFEQLKNLYTNSETKGIVTSHRKRNVQPIGNKEMETTYLYTVSNNENNLIFKPSAPKKPWEPWKQRKQKKHVLIKTGSFLNNTMISLKHKRLKSLSIAAYLPAGRANVNCHYSNIVSNLFTMLKREGNNLSITPHSIIRKGYYALTGAGMSGFIHEIEFNKQRKFDHILSWIEIVINNERERSKKLVVRKIGSESMWSKATDLFMNDAKFEPAKKIPVQIKDIKYIFPQIEQSKRYVKLKSPGEFNASFTSILSIPKTEYTSVIISTFPDIDKAIKRLIAEKMLHRKTIINKNIINELVKLIINAEKQLQRQLDNDERRKD